VRALGDDEAERFATAALVNIPADGSATVQLVNCGLLAPLAINRRGVRPLKEAVSLPLGMLDLAAENVRVACMELDRDETLLLMSDGVSTVGDRSWSTGTARARRRCPCAAA
jgi:serine phosphatase RsbU (regulator of sigma subunit)